MDEYVGFNITKCNTIYIFFTDRRLLNGTSHLVRLKKKKVFFTDRRLLNGTSHLVCLKKKKENILWSQPMTCYRKVPNTRLKETEFVKQSVLT
jgi:hypothetical protein